MEIPVSFENSTAGNKNGSTRREETIRSSHHDRTSLPLFIVAQYTGKAARLQYGIFAKNRRRFGEKISFFAILKRAYPSAAF